ncbi:hypothetical protein PBV87_09205 [Niameybacter massiliensis]|uniref:Uncharacterized protein n=1 Tax=Holtiella tumoricola TaxID=3018743 RepID=A0AA42DMR5_9FIRM|nr:hypothetical protein [Holtiella tumoricola]MDA3731652.1 hypothetical protein [Holtiella tumoricola]
MKNKMIKETKEKLKKYGRMKDFILVRRKELEVQERLLSLEEDELSKKRILRQIEKLQLEIEEVEKDIIAIDKGLSHLNPISSKIIHMKYMKNEKWVAVALNVGYGQTRCRELGRDAVMIIGEFLYGIKINQDLPLVSGATYYYA